MPPTFEQLRRRRAAEADEAGLILIELLIAMVVLGILAGIVVFAVQSAASSTSKTSSGSDYKMVETAVEEDKAEMGNYPSGTGSSGLVTDRDRADGRNSNRYEYRRRCGAGPEGTATNTATAICEVVSEWLHRHRYSSCDHIYSNQHHWIYYRVSVRTSIPPLSCIWGRLITTKE